MDQNATVVVALDMVLEALDDAIAAVNQEGAQAFRGGRYDIAREIMAKGIQMTAFRDKVLELKKEWINSGAPTRTKDRKEKTEVAEGSKRGLRTPEEEFRIPILQTLVELGGSAPMHEVLDRVEKMMKDRLTAHDLLPLPSDPTAVRWRNTAQWARKDMVTEGLLASDSPRGIWEITSKGRQWLVAAARHVK
ncbi:MAG: winged helix-turn-helix domain-containing protein [Candidatus Methanomethylicaceae archaeon]